MKKRILAWLLVCLMVVSSLPVTAFAQDEAATCPGEGNHTEYNCPAAIKIETIEPTCEAVGFTLYQCNVCEEYFVANVKNEVAHKYEKVQDKVDATCGVAGSEQLSKCVWCGEADPENNGDPIDALEHEYEITITGNCIDGYTETQICKKCGDKIETTGEGGHAWNTLPEVIKEPTCIAEGLTKYTCTVEGCGAIKEVPIRANGRHAWVEVKAQDPTCTAAGWKAHYVCSTCDKDNMTYAVVSPKLPGVYIVVEYDADIALAKLAHTPEAIPGKDATCLEDGLTAGSKCSVCGEILVAQEVIKAPGAHDYAFESVKAEGDCDTNRVEIYACSRCDATEERDLGVQHQWAIKETAEAGCTTWGGTTYLCELCGEDKVDKVEPTGHTPEKLEGYAAKCNADGLTDGEKCSVCNEILVAQEKIPATDHNYKVAIPVNGDCSTPNANFYICQNPNCDAEDSELSVGTYTVTTEDDKTYTYDISKFEAPVCVIKVELLDSYNSDQHDLAYVVDQEATCEQDGSGFYYCKNCSYWGGYVEKGGHEWKPLANIVIVPGCKDIKLPAYCAKCDTKIDEYKFADGLGHDWDTENLVTVAPTCKESGHSYFNCKNCEETLTVDAEILFEVPDTRKDPQGNDAPYFFYNEAEATALGHTGTFEYVRTYRKGTCEIIGLDIYKCTDCQAEILIVTDGTGAGHNWVPVTEKQKATCTEPAVWAYECACGAEKEDTYGKPNGHTMLQYPYVEPTCEAPGQRAHEKCSVCDFIVLKSREATADPTIPVIPHNWVEQPYVPATCETDGWNAFTKCSDCPAYKEGCEPKDKQEVLPAIGHSYTIVDSADVSCTQFGYVHQLCTNCGDEYIENYQAATGHTSETVDGSAPTCTEPGLTDGEKCSVCDEILVKQTEIPATGHHNEDGVLLTGKCTDPEKNTCATCGTPVEKDPLTGGHNYVFFTQIEATCEDYSYILKICDQCRAYFVEELTEGELADHIWGDWYEVTPATYTETGVKAHDCTVCGATEEGEIPVLTALNYEISYKNVLGENDPIVNGSIVEVTISVTGENVDVWGLKYEFAFNNAFMQIADKDIKVNNDLFTFHASNATYTGNMGKISFVAVPDVNNGGAVVIDGTVTLAVLTFKVDCTRYSHKLNETKEYTDLAIAETTIGVNGVQTLAATGAELVTEGDTAAITINPIMDVNLDGNIDMKDAMAIFAMVNGEVEDTYATAADIDQDGDVDDADFELIFNYYLGTVSYDKLIDSIVVAE